jgi:hypothetical protein
MGTRTTLAGAALLAAGPVLLRSPGVQVPDEPPAAEKPFKYDSHPKKLVQR